VRVKNGPEQPTACEALSLPITSSARARAFPDNAGHHGAHETSQSPFVDVRWQMKGCEERRGIEARE